MLNKHRYKLHYITFNIKINKCYVKSIYVKIIFNK